MSQGLRISHRGVFSLLVPPGWRHAEEDGVLNLFKPAGVGTFYATLAEGPGEMVEPERLMLALALDFAARRVWPVEQADVALLEIGGQPAAVFEYSEPQGSYWQVWHVAHPSRVGLLSYVCRPDDAELERSQRETIASSFRWEG